MSNVNLPADKFDTSLVFVRPDPLPARVPLDQLAVLPGFNTRVKDDEYNERVTGIAESISANGFFDDKPFAVVMLPDNPTVFIYDGEHRFDAAKIASLDVDFPDGLPVAWAKDGATVKDLTIHLAHGNNGERLNMVELASVVRRMQGLGMEKAEIAAALGRTARHVDNLFVLAAANQTVKKAVAAGKIAGAEAVKLLRKDPKTAATKIAEAVKAAEEKGKQKATPKTMSDAPKPPKSKTVSMSLNFPVGKTMAECLKSMATEIREFVEHGKGDDLITADALIKFSITTVDREAEAEAERKAKEKAEKIAQREREKAEKAEKAAAEKKAADDKRAAEAKLLAEAAAKGSDAKPKGKTAEKAKTPAKGKTADSAKKPVRRKAGVQPTEAPATDETTPPAPESGQDENNGL